METQSYSGVTSISESSSSQMPQDGIWDGPLRGVIAACAAGFLLGWIVPNSDMEDRTLPSLLNKMMSKTTSGGEPEGSGTQTIHDSTSSSGMSAAAAE